MMVECRMQVIVLLEMVCPDCLNTYRYHSDDTVQAYPCFRKQRESMGNALQGIRDVRVM